MTACTDKLLLVHGLIDGELDAAGALAVEEHLKTCDGCHQDYQRLLSLRDQLQTAKLAHTAPDSLRIRIEQSLGGADEDGDAKGAPPQRRSTMRYAGGGLAVAAGVAAVIAFAAPLMSNTARSRDIQLADNQRRALLQDRLTDIAASDRHVVKPWFNGRLGFAPSVPDMTDDGFPLAGGRLDFVDGQPAAAIVYRRRLHVINLFAWKGDTGGTAAQPRTSKLDGYSLVEWRANGLAFAAVSDIDLAELQDFQSRFIARTDNH